MTATMIDRKSEVLHYVQALSESLEIDYRLYVTKSHQNALKNSDRLKSLNPEYHEKCLKEIRNNTYDYKFDTKIEEGKKYLKVIIVSYGSSSVHCFVDKNTGEVYKSASWKSPAKGVRYNLLDATSREKCYHRADWSGSYLYIR